MTGQNNGLSSVMYQNGKQSGLNESDEVVTWQLPREKGDEELKMGE